jgi:hypothetical protein
LTRAGFPEDTIFPVPFFVLADWFSDVVPVALCLVIEGPWPEANLLLQIFECVLRRPLDLAG